MARTADLQEVLHPLWGELRKVRRGDFHRLRRELTRLNKEKGLKADSPGYLDLAKKIALSLEEKRRRLAHPLPEGRQEELPITVRREEIIQAIEKNQVLILAGETGSGKTTQIPKFCLAAGQGVEGKIGCTQPRRIAALSVSQRVAEELGTVLGQEVGCKIRFQDRDSPQGRIKFMTDGILLAETQRDRFLNEYDTLIIDEAHERSLNIDFLLGYLRQLLPKRRDLKVIITSATLDTQKFSQAFGDAPVIQVSGRTYPVELAYRPPLEEGKSLAEQAADGVSHLVEKYSQGDVLVFMPTEQDIRDCCEVLRGRHSHAEILPLYARLSTQDQKRVFSPSSRRRIVVSTNVAETSLTLPGIRFVVDSGLARLAQYYPSSGTFALPIVPISKSSADQRKGRCGRVQAGVCLRLYTPEDYEKRQEFTPPEILRTNLAEVVLRMLSLKLGDPGGFPFIDPPSPQGIRDGYKTLEELGALEGGKRSKEHRLTPLGKTMAELPVDPRLARMILFARGEGCLKEVTLIAAALNVQDPRERPREKAGAADQAHQSFIHPESDFLGLLRIWQALEKVEGDKRAGALKKFCQGYYLSFRRMREWQDIYRQLCLLLEERGYRVRPYEGSEEGLYRAVHRCILGGFLSHIGVKREKFFYRATRGRELTLFPGSALSKKKSGADWIVCGQIVETSRLYGRMAANIDPTWLEELGGHLLSSSYHSPLWYQNQGMVMVQEQRRLYGFLLSERQVPYGPINPEEATDLFIRGALIEGALRDPSVFPFLEANRKLIDSIVEMENKIRRRNLLVGDETLFALYKDRLGRGVYDLGLLGEFLKERGQEALLFREEELLEGRADLGLLDQFPDKITLGGIEIAVEYNFDPGQEADGVTLQIPAAQAPQVPTEELDQAIPGIQRERIEALIRGLSKKFRKQLAPIGATVDGILGEMEPEETKPLSRRLSEFIYSRWGISIPPVEWDEGALPEHLRLRFALTDDRGKVLETARGREILYKGLEQPLEPKVLRAQRAQWEREGISHWDLGVLPSEIHPPGGGRRLYPALEDRGEKEPCLTLFEDPSAAQRSHREGLALLLALHFKKEIRGFQEDLRPLLAGTKGSPSLGGEKAVEKALWRSLLREEADPMVRSPEDFERLCRSLAPRLYPLAQGAYRQVLEVLEALGETQRLLVRLEQRGGRRDYIAARKEELEELFPPNWMEDPSLPPRGDLLRYLRYIRIRSERGVLAPQKDREREERYLKHYRRYEKALTALPPFLSPQKREAREVLKWYFWEYKISLFAGEMKTKEKVSDQRLQGRIEDFLLMG